MSRSQQNQTFQTAQQQNQDYNQGAKQGFQNAQQGVTDYGNQLSKFASSNPYVQGGQLQTAQTQDLADVSQGTADATKQAIEGAAARTGSNMGGAVAGAEEVAQQNQRTLAGQVARANEDRINAGADYNARSLAGYQTKEQMQDELAREQAQAAQGALGTQEQAAQQPSFMDMLGQGMITAGQTFASAYCPAEGSLIRMADGTEKPVEEIAVGDELHGVDGSPQRVLLIERRQSPVFSFIDTLGRRGCASPTHALLLPYGGFTEVAECADKLVGPAGDAVRILSVYEDGERKVYNLVTDGGHTYCADGFWALGMSWREFAATQAVKDADVAEVR